MSRQRSCRWPSESWTSEDGVCSYAIYSIRHIGTTIMFILKSPTSIFGTFDTGCLRSTTFGRSDSDPPRWPLKQSILDAFQCPSSVCDRCNLEGIEQLWWSESDPSCRPTERSILNTSQRRLDRRRTPLPASRFSELILTKNMCKHVLVLHNEF